MSANLPYENDLLMEAEGLEILIKFAQATDSIIDKLISDYGECLEPVTVIAFECIQQDLARITEGRIEMDNKVHPGLLKQLENCLDEIQVLQVGKETKHGIKDED